MVGMQTTTASLAKCYESTARKISYPIIRQLELRRNYSFQDNDETISIAAERAQTYNKDEEDGSELPF